MRREKRANEIASSLLYIRKRTATQIQMSGGPLPFGWIVARFQKKVWALMRNTSTNERCIQRDTLWALSFLP